MEKNSGDFLPSCEIRRLAQKAETSRLTLFSLRYSGLFYHFWGQGGLKLPPTFLEKYLSNSLQTW